MANEATIITATTILAQASGASTIAASGGLCAAADVGVVTNAGTSDYPLMSLEFRGAFASGALDGESISFYVQRAGEGDVDANNMTGFVGSVVIDSVPTAEQTVILDGVPCPVGVDFDIWVENNTTGEISTTWDLDVTPYTYGTAA